MTDEEKQAIVTQIEAEGVDIGSLTAVTSITGVNALPALLNGTLVLVPITLLAQSVAASSTISDALASKVDKVSGKSLSTNDLSDAYKAVLDRETVGTGDKALILGNATDNTASGQYSLAAGSVTTASGLGAIALGCSSTASGQYSFVWGYQSTASGVDSLALGDMNTSSDRSAMAIGFSNIASGKYSISIGCGLQTIHNFEMAVGKYNTHTGEPTDNNIIFSVGCGTSDTSRANAIEVWSDGKTYINGSLEVGGVLTITQSGSSNVYTKTEVSAMIAKKSDEWTEVSSGFTLGAYKYMRVYVKCEASSGAQRQAVADIYIGDFANITSKVIAARLMFYGDSDNSIVGGVTATLGTTNVTIGVALGTAYKSSYTITIIKILVK